jgi:hypothetical protein
MLGYVFWHWPRQDSGRTVYEAGLGRFHTALLADAPEGFVSSAVFGIPGASWLGRDAAYEDWYLITDFDALGNLNEGAVSGSRAASHDGVAAQAAGGTGGLYRAIVGAGRLAPARHAAWFAKPSGMRYPDFFAALARWTTQPDITLWQRQLTLGPAPEFCLHAVERHALPEEFSPNWIELTPVWLPDSSAP